jgi:hypothetical protein
LLSRLSNGSTDGASWIALWPGPPASRKTGSASFWRAIAGTTT